MYTITYIILLLVLYCPRFSAILDDAAVNIRCFLYLKLFSKAECYTKRHKAFRVKNGKMITLF